MTFYSDISTTYGHHVTNMLKEVANTNRRLATQKNRRIFLLRCKNMNIYPNYLKLNIEDLKFKGTYLNNKFYSIISKTKTGLLNLSITEATKNINILIKNKTEIIKKITKIIPTESFSKFLDLENKKYETLFKINKQKHQKKLNQLTNHVLPKQNTKANTNWIKNISNTIIPEEVSEVLAMGPEFAINVTKETQLPITDYIAAIETTINDLPENTQITIRAETTNIITNYKNKIKQKTIKSNETQNKIKKNLLRTKIFLKDNPQIMVLKPDKSNKTVVMNTCEYETKMDILLNDQTTYTKLKSDPTVIFEKKNNALIKKLKNNKEINDQEAKRLTIHNSIPPKIYGLPKLHKENVPLRPIVSSVQSPFYNLSKYLANCISHITGKNNYYIKDSFEFKTFIDNIYIPNDYKLISLDVISLYTNIPQELVQTVISNKWNDLKQFTTISKENFIEAVNLTLSTNYCQYKDTFYKQIDGCAMGSPISSTIAQLVMEFLEENVLSNLTFNTLFFKRFVDDCITAIPTEKTEELLSAFNKFHSKLQFTAEIEENGKLNFLDMTLCRNKENNKIETKWYTKPTWSGRYLNNDSNHSKKQKTSAIIGLTDRAIILTSPVYRPECLKKVKDILISNGHKEKHIEQIFKKRTYKFYNQLKNKTTKNENKKRLILPYINGLSEKIQFALKKHDIITCHKSHNKLGTFFTKLKSKTPTMKQSNVIYSIPCAECPKKYIGMTSQLLQNRLKGHKYTQNASTALNKHTKDTKHDFNYNETKILNRDSNYQKLKIKEMIEIRRDTNVVNDRTDIAGLSQIYQNLIHTK